MWQMNDVRSRAIAQLSTCATPTAKIVYGRAYDHSPWFLDGYRELCVRSKPLTVEEVEGLSLKEVIGVAEARERIRSEVMISSPCMSPPCMSPWPPVAFGSRDRHRTRVKTTQYTLPDDEHHGESVSRSL